MRNFEEIDFREIALFEERKNIDYSAQVGLKGLSFLACMNRSGLEYVPFLVLKFSVAPLILCSYF